jgi:quercetin dioxygenase-like cupin family protein
VAQELAFEVAGSAERKKKAIPSPAGIQAFLLYLRAKGSVPTHKVSGAIAVHTVLGIAMLTAGPASHCLPTGSMVCVAAGLPHEIFARTETVLLVTYAIQG